MENDVYIYGMTVLLTHNKDVFRIKGNNANNSYCSTPGHW
jgi:hypothetical protein